MQAFMQRIGCVYKAQASDTKQFDRAERCGIPLRLENLQSSNSLVTLLPTRTNPTRLSHLRLALLTCTRSVHRKVYPSSLHSFTKGVRLLRLSCKLQNSSSPHQKTAADDCGSLGSGKPATPNPRILAHTSVYETSWLHFCSFARNLHTHLSGIPTFGLAPHRY